MMQSRDRGDSVTQCMQHGNPCIFGGGQQTAEKPCDSQPSAKACPALPVKGEARHVIMISCANSCAV